MHSNIEIVCTVCIKPVNTQAFIGECKHILCDSCYSVHNYYHICHSKINFLPFDEKFIKKCREPCNVMFEKCILIMQLQLDSLTLQNQHLKSKISSYKIALKEAKEELMRSHESTVEEKLNSVQFLNFKLFNNKSKR